MSTARPAVKILCLALLALACVPAAGLAQEAHDPPLVIEEMQCRGNVTTSCRAILRNLFLAVGDPVDEEEIQNAKLRLAWLPNFESVEIYLEKGSERGRARLVVAVVEASAVEGDFRFGLLSQTGSFSNLVNARVSNWNLFGEGKALHVAVGAETPLAGLERRGRGASVEYADPQLFGSKKYYLSTLAFYNDLRYELEGGGELAVENLGAQVLLGRRLWDFSFVSVGYQFRAVNELFERFRRDDGTFGINTHAPSGLALFRFGWHSEDDPYFPASGSWLSVNRFSSSSDDADEEWTVFYRRTWRTDGSSLWTFQFESQRNVSVAFARPIGASGQFGGVRRGRWYVAPLMNRIGHDASGDDLYEVGVRAGVRLDTTRFGIVDLFVVGTGATHTGFIP